MKKLKTYENWFKDIFKSAENDIWNEYMSDEMEKSHGYNSLMDAAETGNLKKFKYYFPKFKNKINNLSLNGLNTLIYVVIGDGTESDKKYMIKTLIDNGINYNIKYDHKYFYELIKENRLQKWVKETYPDIIDELELYKITDKYNV